MIDVGPKLLFDRAESIARMGSWYWDFETHDFRWSDGLYQLLGLEPGSVQPSIEALMRRIHPPDRELVLKANQRFREEPNSLPNQMLPRMRVRIIRKDKSPCLVELFGRIVSMKDGRPRHAIGVVQEFSQTHTTPNALKEASEVLRMANQIQGLATWRWDMVSGEVKWTDEAYALMGYERSVEPSLNAMLDALHPDDREADRFCTRLAPNADPVEVRFVHPDGTVRHVMSSFGTVQDEFRGGQAVVIGILMDISERRGLEDELRQTRKMEALGRMASNIAHDFNNYLAVTMGNAEFVKECIPESEVEMLESLHDILQAAQRCQEMTQRLLDFGRSNRCVMRKIDVGQLLQDRKSMLRCLAGPLVTISFDLAKTGAVVRADETSFEQLLMNLVTNARDAMPLGGLLKFRTWVEKEFCGSWVVLQISDDGVGMDSETLERIFEPFFTTKTVGQGSGLGMASVHTIIQQHQGRIQITSEPNRGTTVTLWFPGHRS